MIRVTTRALVALAVVVAATVVPVPMAWSAPETRMATLADPARPGGQEVSFPVSHVGLRWVGDDDAVVQLRWAVDGAWRPWQEVTVSHDLEDRARGLVYSGLMRVDGASELEARVVAGRARSLRIVALDTKHGPRRLVPAPAPAASASAIGPSRVAQRPVISRAQWGADESLRAPRQSHAPVTKLIVHHTATTNDDPDPAATIRAIYSFHTQIRGWDDIGYNFLVDAQGRVYEGRFARTYAAGENPTGEDVEGNAVVGAHAEGANTGSVGIALLGDFIAASPTPAAFEALESMLAWQVDRHYIDPTGSAPYTKTDGSVVTFPNIAGHRDTRATDCPGDSLYSRLPELRRAMPRPGPRPAGPASLRPAAVGYWLAGRDGAVRAFGEAPFLGDVAKLALNSPLQGITPTPARAGPPGGYWLLGGDGGIFAFGDAAFFGSTGALELNQPVVGMAATPTGKGYWLVASDGGIFAFGDAAFFGSTGALRLNKPVVGMAPTATGKGYWLVASDGGIFAFGDATFRGSTGAIRLNSPVVGMDGGPGGGYWLVARDGGMFAFGVPFLGSVPGLRLASYAGSVSMGSSPSGQGYYVLGSDGGIFTFGDAKFFGARPGLTGRSAAADLAVATVLAPAR
ncbi:MAG: peptidoglycan recognition protein [Actinomycetota bacterium]|nr:peptidoglycan recognition protein [Actinomycetota bacterium]